MNLKTLFVSVTLSFSLIGSLHAQVVALDWVKQLGGSGNEFSETITTDNQGNVYVAGSLYGSGDYDPGSGVLNLFAKGYADIFVEKLNANGDLVWVKHIGSSGNEVCYDVAVDDDGNVYTTGYFDTYVDFDPGTDTTFLDDKGLGDIFIQKFDSNGNFLWVKQIGGPGSDVGQSLTLDGSGNLYVTGHFSSDVDFDPGADSSVLNATGYIDVFVLKLDPNGDFVWVKQIEGTNYTYGKAVEVDGQGNVYTTGYFRDTVDINPGAPVNNFVSNGEEDMYIQKLDADGNYVWAKHLGGAEEDQARSVAVDASGNVYTTGFFRSTVDFDPGAGTNNVTSGGFQDVFIHKLDSNGNFSWVKIMGDASSDEGYALTLDKEGNIYTIGAFLESIDMDPSFGSEPFTSNGWSDIFIQKMDPDGNFVWAKQMGGTDSDRGTAIALDKDGNIYCTGDFLLTVDFDPDTGIFSLNAKGASDIYIQKLGSTDTSNVGIPGMYSTHDHVISVCPVPTSGPISLTFDNIIQQAVIHLRDMQGKLLSSSVYENVRNVNFNLDQPVGMYMLEIVTEDTVQFRRIVKK